MRWYEYDISTPTSLIVKIANQSRYQHGISELFRSHCSEWKKQGTQAACIKRSKNVRCAIVKFHFDENILYGIKVEFWIRFAFITEYFAAYRKTFKTSNGNTSFTSRYLIISNVTFYKITTRNSTQTSVCFVNFCGLGPRHSWLYLSEVLNTGTELSKIAAKEEQHETYSTYDLSNAPKNGATMLM